ncbi:MAG: hypothetical protein ACTHLD_04535 [Chitinophaga sp.]
MKKALFLAGMLLMAAMPNVFSMPSPAGNAVLNPKNVIESSVNRLYPPTLVPVAKMANGMIKAVVKRGSETATDPVYVWLGYINEYQSGPGLYGDVEMRFYSDLNATIPYTPGGLQVNYAIVGYVEGSGGYETPQSLNAYSQSIMIAYNQEHDYDDGTNFRWKDYYLRPGDYSPLS